MAGQTGDIFPVECIIFYVDSNSLGSMPGRVLNKVLYGEAPSRGPTPYHFTNYLWQERYPFRMPSTENLVLFMYQYLLKKNYIPFLNPRMRLMNNTAGEHQA